MWQSHVRTPPVPARLRSDAAHSSASPPGRASTVATACSGWRCGASGRAGFRFYWRLRSRGGRRKVGGDVFEIVGRMARENPSWGAPGIHGELLKLGFLISERTVSRYLVRGLPRRGDAAGNWRAFLGKHREAIAALDFFTVPTMRLRLLYCFFAIDHARPSAPPLRHPGPRRQVQW